VAANPNRAFFRKFKMRPSPAAVRSAIIGRWARGFWGLETDIDYDGLNQTNSANTILTGALVGGNALNSASQRFDRFGTVRGRVGFVPSPTWLLYATGGLAWATSAPAPMCFSRSPVAAVTTTQRLDGSRWMDCRWWWRVDVHAELVGQGRISLCQSGLFHLCRPLHNPDSGKRYAIPDLFNPRLDARACGSCRHQLSISVRRSSRSIDRGQTSMVRKAPASSGAFFSYVREFLSA
jgi:hypothetical protein